MKLSEKKLREILKLFKESDNKDFKDAIVNVVFILSENKNDVLVDNEELMSDLKLRGTKMSVQYSQNYFNLSDDSLKVVLKILIRAGEKTKPNGSRPNWSWQRTKGTPEYFHRNVRLEYYLKGLKDGGRKNAMEIYDKAQKEVREESEEEE